MATNIEVIVGTYEQFLLGYKVEQVSDSLPKTPVTLNESHFLSNCSRAKMIIR